MTTRIALVVLGSVALVALAVHASRETLDDPPASSNTAKKLARFVNRIRSAALAGCNFKDDPVDQARGPTGIVELRLYMVAQTLAWLVGGSFVDTYTPNHKVAKKLMKNTVLRVAMASDPKNAPLAALQEHSGCIVLNVWHRDMGLTEDLDDSEREKRLIQAVVKGLALTSGSSGSKAYEKAYKLIDDYAKNLVEKFSELKEIISLKGFKVV
jgi:hypothetical protein